MSPPPPNTLSVVRRTSLWRMRKEGVAKRPVQHVPTGGHARNARYRRYSEQGLQALLQRESYCVKVTELRLSNKTAMLEGSGIIKRSVRLKTCWAGIPSDGTCIVACKNYALCTSCKILTSVQGVCEGCSLPNNTVPSAAKRRSWLCMLDISLYTALLSQYATETLLTLTIPVAMCVCRYSSLRTNLPRQIMSFSDFPFIPEAMDNQSHDPRRFPSHTEVQAWLEVFAARFKLWQHIEFNSQVTSLLPIFPADTNSDPGASAAVATEPRWKLTVQRSPASLISSPQHAAQQASHTCRATSTSYANTGPVNLLQSVSNFPSAEASTTKSALHPSSHGTACHIDSAINSNHCDGLTHGMSQQPGVAPTNPPLMKKPQASEHNSVSQTQDVSSHQLPSCDDANALGQSHYEFDAVVVCVGNYHQPNLPDVKGIDDFPGLQMHAHNYRNPAMFAGRSVIIVGASFSGETSSRLRNPILQNGLQGAMTVQSSVSHLCCAHCWKVNLLSWLLQCIYICSITSPAAFAEHMLCTSIA